MQSVSSAFTAEERDRTRQIAHNLQVSWKKVSSLTSRTFTIGTSIIGGNDVIGLNPEAIGSPGIYVYDDESDYVLSMAWERGLNIPAGGLTKALAEAILDNTSGRFTPRYMGGQSSLYTAIKPGRPMIINAGFRLSGVDTMIPQFAGIVNEQPSVDTRSRTLGLKAADYSEYFQNKVMDTEVMFTGQRTDQVMTTLSNSLGMFTSQYDYDVGLNTIPFGYFPVGTKFADVFHQLTEAENGQFYQDEEGVFKFENANHWNSAPHTQIQRILYTAQVIEAQAPSTDHIVNVVEINAPIREKRSNEAFFSLASPIEIPANGRVDQVFAFDDPVLQIIAPTVGGAYSFYVANAASDGSGTDRSSNISVELLATYAQSAQYRIRNNIASTVYVTEFVLAGRVARHVSDLYYRQQDDSSVTAYNEKILSINNPFIQSENWATAISDRILQNFAEIENLQRLTIRAIPELQLGDLVSWQGRYWRVYDIKTSLESDIGFIQELLLLQRS